MKPLFNYRNSSTTKTKPLTKAQQSQRTANFFLDSQYGFSIPLEYSNKQLNTGSPNKLNRFKQKPSVKK